MMYSKILTLLLLVMLAVGCSQSFYGQGRKHLNSGRYAQAIAAFYDEIGKNPSSIAAWRELGVTFYKKGDFGQAEEALKQANNIRPDSRTHLFLGLTYEAQELWDKALDAFGASLSLRPRGKTASMTRAHIDLLLGKKIAREVADAIENEAAIDVDTIPAHTIAVSDFDGSLLSEEMAPLARGLAEIVSIDLAKVNSLAVVERQKLAELMDELKLSASGYVDPATAPRVGKLLGADKLVTGSLMGLGEEALMMNGIVVKTATGDSLAHESTEGELRQLLKMEKEFVFSIINQLGIKLSVKERDDIQEIPTESYLAFLAYSRGLEYQSAGMHDAARQEFNNAFNEDPGFDEAGAQAENEALSSEAGTLGETYDWLADTSPDGGGDGDTDTGTDDYLASQPGVLGATGGSPFDDVVDDEPQVGTTGTVIVNGDLNAN